MNNKFIVLFSMVLMFSVPSFSAIPPDVSLSGKVVKMTRKVVYMKSKKGGVMRIPQSVFKKNKIRPRVGKTAKIKMDIKKFIKLN